VGKRGFFYGEEGSVLVLAVVILVLLTIIGISATTTSTIEMQIAGNERTHKQNLYKAEAAGVEAAWHLEVGNLDESQPDWLKGSGTVDEDSILCDRSSRCGASEKAAVSDEVNQDAGFLAESRGIASGSSLDMRKASVHEYRIYGWGDEANGLVIVRMGYRKAF